MSSWPVAAFGFRFPAFVVAIFLVAALGKAYASDTDNIHILDERRSYVVQPSGQVKMVEETTYEALRADGRVIATTMFNEDISIDKASAPGAKPYYRSWEDGDLFYTGSRICLMAVPLKKGKPAKVTFEQTYRAPEQFCNVFLTAPYATEKSLITVEVPASLAGRYKVVPKNLDSSMTFDAETERNGNVTYSVRSEGRLPYRHEPEAPSASIDAPQLVVTGVFADVGELYGFFRNYSKPYADATGAVADLSARITAGCESDIEKIDSIASWVRQNIRYVAVEHGEYGIRPEPAADVLARRYGDCKGSASLLKGLLLEAGIDGRLVWIGTAGEVASRWDSVPSLMSGNHQIAAAVLGDSIIYIDGTTTWAPAGYIPPSLRGQQALIEDGDGYMLRTVPEACRQADTDTVTAHFTIADGDLRGSLARDMGGVFKMSAAGAFYGIAPADRRQMLGRILAYPKKNISCQDVRLELETPSAQRCRMVCDSIIDRGAARAMGDKLIVDLRPVRDMYLNTVDLKDRRRGVAKPFGYTYVAGLALEIPDGYEVETLPGRQDFDSPWYGGFIAYRVSDGLIECEAEVHTRRTEARADELTDLNSAVRNIIRASESKIILRKTINQ